MWLFRLLEHGRTMVAWTVMDSAGRDVGLLRAPLGEQVQIGTATHVWTARREADGVATVIRYRIVR